MRSPPGSGFRAHGIDISPMLRRSLPMPAQAQLPSAITLGTESGEVLERHITPKASFPAAPAGGHNEVRTVERGQ